jgi:hypothetical protein
VEFHFKPRRAENYIREINGLGMAVSRGENSMCRRLQFRGRKGNLQDDPGGYSIPEISRRIQLRKELQSEVAALTTMAC